MHLAVIFLLHLSLIMT